jgi:hypothetical protein
MVSSHIARNTVVNAPMHHGSFMYTVGKKWNKMAPGKFPPLTARVTDAPDFSKVFTSAAPRPKEDWPDIPKPAVPDEFWARDFSRAPLSKFQRSILVGASMLPQARKTTARAAVPRDPSAINTTGAAMEYLKSIPGAGPEEPLSTFK